MFTYPSIIPSGTNLIATISGSQNLGSSNIPFENVYAKSFNSNLASFAQITASGLAYFATENIYTPLSGISNTYSSGNTFAGNNFSVIASGSSPQIVYNGASPIWVKCELQVSAELTASNCAMTTQIFLNGSGVGIYNQGQNFSTSNSYFSSWNNTAITQMFSGNSIQGRAQGITTSATSINSWLLNVSKLI